MELWQIIVLIVGGLVLFLIISYFIFLYSLFLVLFKRMKHEVLLTDVDLEKTHYKPFMDMVIRNIKVFSMIPYYKVSITSNDGYKLYGKYYKNGDSKKTLVFFHGYHADPLNNINTPGLMMLKKGYNILLITERAHGESEGKYITFGVKEKEDALLWLSYLNDNYHPENIVLWGVSMGCATVEMISNKLPSNVSLLVLDCGFTGAYEEVLYSLEKRCKYKPKVTMFFLSIFARLHGFKLEKGIAKDSLKGCTIPALFIHGEKDLMVPMSMGMENYNSHNGVKKKLIIDAGHAVSIYVGYKEIEEEIDKLLNEYVK